MQELLSAAATLLNAPEALVLRSAEARAKASGGSAEDVLRAWTGGGEVPATPEPQAAPDPAPAPAPAAPAPAAPTPAPAAPAAGALDGAGLLAAAAALLKAPESLVRRSAEARAKASGTSAEDVLQAWTGGDAVRSAPAPAPDTAVTAVPEPAPAAAPAAAAAEPSGPPVEVLEPEPAPEPAGEQLADADEEPAPTGGGIPRWLVAAFLVIPAFAVLYALFLPNGPNCGDAGKLAIDPASGLAVNCDGSEYGVEVVNYFALGEEVYGQCTSCHGANGGGGGNFPAFADGALDATFPEGTCSDQVEWVRLGSSGWPDGTYGATAKEVGSSGAAMPAFGNVLSEEELRSVVLFERVQFSGYDLDATLADCGLGEEAAAE